jgi:acetyl-CoA carboxylase carboxyltransferase component
VIVAVVGNGVGRSSFSAIQSEFSVLTKGASMALAGHAIVKAAIGVDITSDELGGPEVHSKVTGMIDRTADSEPEAVELIKRFLSYFPNNSFEYPPRVLSGDPVDRTTPEFYDIVPLKMRRAYDMHRVVRGVLDNGEFFEIKPNFARNLIVGYGRIDGWAVGVIANQPMFLGGILDPNAAIKLVRFLQISNSYNIPLVFLQDQPGFIVGPDHEKAGLIRHVVRVSNAVSELTVPILTVLIRKAYGFSFLLLGARQFGGDAVVAWPSASVSLAGPEAGVSTLLDRERKAGTLTPERQEQIIQDYIEMSRARFAAYDGRLDDVIEPERTREFLGRCLNTIGRRRPEVVQRRKPRIETA